MNGKERRDYVGVSDGGKRLRDVSEGGADGLEDEMKSVGAAEVFKALAGFRQGVELAESELERRVQAFLQAKIGKCRDNRGEWRLGEGSNTKLNQRVVNGRAVIVLVVPVYQYGDDSVRFEDNSLHRLLVANSVGVDNVPISRGLCITIPVDELDAGLGGGEQVAGKAAMAFAEGKAMDVKVGANDSAASVSVCRDSLRADIAEGCGLVAGGEGM